MANDRNARIKETFAKCFPAGARDFEWVETAEGFNVTFKPEIPPFDASLFSRLNATSVKVQGMTLEGSFENKPVKIKIGVSR